MTGVQILVLIAVVVVIALAVTAVWIRRRRAGGVLIGGTANTPSRHGGGS